MRFTILQVSTIANDNEINQAKSEAVKMLNLQVEELVRLALKPSPRWIPKRTWVWLASKFVVLERLS